MKALRGNPPISVYEVLESTNDSILAAGEAGAPEGTTHIALAQTRGRGRGRHSWWSPPGAGLWMSTLLRPRHDRARWGGLSLVSGAAAREALVSLGIPAVELYWPNDLQVGRAKLGGILGEVRSQGERAWIALGIGINIDFSAPEVRASMPEELRQSAVSMVEAGTPATTEPVAIAQAILGSFWPLYERFQAGESVARLAGREVAHAGREVEVRVPGRPPFQGTIAGLGEGGELLVHVQPRRGGPRSVPAVATVTAGEVVYLEEKAAHAPPP